MTTKKLIFTLIALTLLSVSCEQRKNISLTPAEHTIIVRDQTVAVEIADSPEKRTLGLSYRDSLPQQSGMLFDFRDDPNKRPEFWMKEMRFPIDIIWIYHNKIVAINDSVPAPPANTPIQDLPLYTPPSNIDYVLEVNAGWSKAHNIQVGDNVQF